MSKIKDALLPAILLFTLLLVSGCQSPPVNLPPPVVSAAEITPSPSPIPSRTSIPSQTATATITPSPTAPLHPLTIDAMRMATYPGSPITFEQRLENGTNFERHLVSYQSEGLKIYALMTIPFGDPPPGGFPAIIFNHGYIPPREYRTTERYVAYVNGFASRGYVVFRSDFRGHGDSEGEARGAYSYPDYTIDVLNALASVRAYPQVNPEKIGMWGHSMGGHLTLRAMVVSPYIRAGVIWAGVVGSYEDMMYRWRATPVPTFSATSRRFTRQLVETYGLPEENPSFWDSISPIRYVADLSGPIQLHHAVEDSVVPVYFSEQLLAAGQAAGVLMELYTYAGDDHNLATPFSLAMQRSIDFFDRYLK